MLQKYVVFTNYRNRLPLLRYYQNVNKLITKRSLSTHQFPVWNQSRRLQCVNLAAKIESHLNSRCINLTRFNEFITRRNYCTKTTKKIDRSWSSIRKQQQESRKEIRRLFTFASNEKWYLIVAIGCLLVSSAVTLGVPRAIGKLLDMIVLDSFPREKLNSFCVILFGIFVIGGLANFGRIYLINSASKCGFQFDLSCHNSILFNSYFSSFFRSNCKLFEL